MNETIAHELLDELFSSLEALETQSAAVLQFLKDKGLASEEELAPHFEQAANASNVRWRAARVRIERLLSSAMKAEEPEARQESPRQESSKAPENVEEPRTETQTARAEKSENGAPTAGGKSPEEPVDGAQEQDRNKQVNKDSPRAERPAEDAA